MAQNIGSLEKSSSDLHVEIFDDEKHKDVDTVAEAGLTDFDQAEVKRILRKIDLRLLPVLTALYLMSFLDRSNSQYDPSQSNENVLTCPFSRQRQCSRPLQRPWPLLSVIQPLPNHLLLPLRPLRSSLQYRPQVASPIDMATHHRACMGHRHDAHGHRARIQWASCREILLGCH